MASEIIVDELKENGELDKDNDKEKRPEEGGEKMRRMSDIKGRLRNYSYQQANIASSAASNPTEVCEEAVAEENSSEIEQSENNDSIMGSMEDIIRPRVLLKKEDWQGKNNNHKLDSVLGAVNKLYMMHEQVKQRLVPLEIAVFDKESGILPQLSQIVGHAKSTDTKYEDLQAENLQLREELEIVKGVVTKQGKQIEALQYKQADQTARSMANNIAINGILGDTEKADLTENKVHVLTFLEEKLKLNIDDDEDVITAQRFGPFQEGKHRPIVIKVTEKLAKRIFANTSKLSKIRNDENKPYSVNPQLPDLIAEQRREIRQIIKEKKSIEEHLPKEQKSKFLIRKGKVYINGQLQRRVLKPPTLQELFVDEKEQEKINRIKTPYVTTEPIKGSKFKATAVIVHSLNDVHLAYKKLFQDNPAADHIVAAFSAEHTTGYQDNGEFGAGFRVLNVIQDHHFSDIAVFVIREYGGENLGPQRFIVIKELASKAIELVA